MPLSDKYVYPRVKIVRESKAWEIIGEQAAYYGKTEGELIGDIAIAWTKMLSGEWNLHWPAFMANVTANTNGNGAISPPFPGSEEARRKREEDERKLQERKEARLAAARAELLDE